MNETPLRFIVEPRPCHELLLVKRHDGTPEPEPFCVGLFLSEEDAWAHVGTEARDRYAVHPQTRSFVFAVVDQDDSLEGGPTDCALFSSFEKAAEEKARHDRSHGNRAGIVETRIQLWEVR